jgi:hypothetical protein
MNRSRVFLVDRVSRDRRLSFAGCGLTVRPKTSETSDRKFVARSNTESESCAQASHLADGSRIRVPYSCHDRHLRRVPEIRPPAAPVSGCRHGNPGGRVGWLRWLAAPCESRTSGGQGIGASVASSGVGRHRAAAGCPDLPHPTRAVALDETYFRPLLGRCRLRGRSFRRRAWELRPDAAQRPDTRRQRVAIVLDRAVQQTRKRDGLPRG